ncbi:hypothetical protein [Streptomyces jumonjinensis]|nr:hypothetical protein [Streptomyces jumonjinensis]
MTRPAVVGYGTASVAAAKPPANSALHGQAERLGSGPGRAPSP